MRTLLALAAILVQMTAVAQQAPPPSSSPAGAPRILCMAVRDKPLSERLFGSTLPNTGRKHVDGTVATQQASSASGAGTEPNTALVGTGDLELVISRSDYDQAAGYEKSQNTSLLLYVNGVALPSDAQLASIEHLRDGTHMRYRINQGVDTQTLWSSIYRDKGLLGEDSLRPALGWSNQGPGASFTASEDCKIAPARITITSGGQAAFAAAVLLALLGGLVLVGWKTDALRDAPLPSWWREAADIRTRLKAPGATETQVLTAIDPTYDPSKRQDYIALAADAVDGRPVPADRPKLVPIGLALSTADLHPVRASFSLSRVQMAMWFAFAVAAGLFLWIIYGQLRRIDGSLLALLMISVGTTGVSLGVDRNAGGRPYSRSHGLFLDLVTGFDDSHQVHRYQAVVVNLLLLFVGIAHVVQQLTYPIFEPTWLALLGVSGATLGLGKQVLEKPSDASVAGAPGKAAGTGSTTAAQPDGSVG